MLRLHGDTSSPDKYWRKWLNQQAHLELCRGNPGILKRMLNWMLSNSTARNFIMDPTVQKYRFGKEKYIKQITDIWEWQKITAEFGRKKVTCLKRIRGYNTGEERGSRNSFSLGNDKNNIIIIYLFIKLFI